MRAGASAVTFMALLSAGCAIQRAEIAQQAQHQMVGLSREQVLQCMGPPGNKMADGGTEVWSYESPQLFLGARIDHERDK